MEQAIIDLLKKIRHEIEQMDTRLIEMGGRLEKINKRQKKSKDRLKKVKKRQKEMGEDLEEMEKKMDQVIAQMITKDHLEKFQKEIRDYHREVNQRPLLRYMVQERRKR